MHISLQCLQTLCRALFAMKAWARVHLWPSGYLAAQMGDDTSMNSDDLEC